MIARVAVSLGLNREFDYVVPDHLAPLVRMGSRVTVPFGRRKIDGTVTALPARAAVKDLKTVLAVEGTSPFLDEPLLKLARWMADYYCAPFENCIRTLLPGAVRRTGQTFKEQLWIRLADQPDPGGAGETASGMGVPPMRHGQDARATLQESASKTLQGLSEQQARVLAVLAEHAEGLWLQELLRAARVTVSPAKTLARKGRVVIEPRTRARDPFAEARVLPTLPLELTGEQDQALGAIVRSMAGEGPPVTLLYGVTGSGKTEVYLQAMAHALEQDGAAIVLVPEIALTPQTVSRFRSRFGERIAVLHSNLSEGERHDEWHRLSTGGARVAIGARSAVFAPLRNLKLIVVDEEHEPSYKQSESPRYHARDVAVMRGHLCGCAVVLGTATPSLESWRNAGDGKYGRVDLKVRADDRSMPLMRVIDMRIEAERHGHPCVFSQDLLDATATRIERGEQVMYFLNRRGYSTALICPKCGHVSECGACGIAHTYHRTDDSLRCHLCGRREAVPTRCPGCGDPAFRYTGVGTQRVESAARKCFPTARIARLDADTTHRRASYEEVLGAFRAGEIDLLIGTQMIAKGLHFPNITLVGVINADLSLHMADFRAGERTYQLLAQVSGRAGRGAVTGEVLVQTYTPHHPAIQAARTLDFETLSAQELEFRRELSYPPYAHLICLLFRGTVEAAVMRAAEGVSAALTERLARGGIVAAAAPAPMAKIDGRYRYQVMIRTRAVTRTGAVLRTVLEAQRLPRDVTVQIDVDAVSLL